LHPIDAAFPLSKCRPQGRIHIRDARSHAWCRGLIRYSRQAAAVDAEALITAHAAMLSARSLR
jgi:hypothetical protein